MYEIYWNDEFVFEAGEVLNPGIWAQGEWKFYFVGETLGL